MDPNANPPRFASQSWTVPDPQLVRRIPEDQPLVLNPRLSRFYLVFGTIYLGFPLVLMLIGLTALLTRTDGAPEILAYDLAIVLFPMAILVVGGLVQMAIIVAVGASGGPYLAANTDGLWIRARKWPARSVYLPWPVIARIYARRWLWDRSICVLAHDPMAGARAGTMARLDMAVQRAIFGSRLTASCFYSGRRAEDVLAELRRLSEGRVPIG